MKKVCFLIFLLTVFADFTIAAAQSDIRVKCGRFTMNVTSENTRCYQVEENIVMEENALPEQIERAQVANTAIYFSDFEQTRSSIPPQVTFYLIDDLGKTSFDLLDRALALSDITNNLQSNFSTAQDIYQDVPFLPYQAQEKKLTILPERIDFENGTGIRTVVSFSDTIASQGSSTNLFYSYQGISHDGNYYISAVFPLLSAGLNGQTSTAAAAGADDFQPSLAQLDYYIHSIVIE